MTTPQNDPPLALPFSEGLGLGPARAAFEHAMVAGDYALDFLILDGGKRYAYLETEWAFRGWEAATAAERERWATAAWLAVEATPDQLPLALDALADVLRA